MLPLRRAALEYSSRSPWLRTRPQGIRVRHRQQAERKSSGTSQTNPPKDSSTPSPTRSNDLPPHSLNEVPVGETAKPIEPVDIPLQLWYHRLGLVSDFFRWFHRAQAKRPYAVQLGTTLTTYLCGDLLAQEIGGELYDPWRTARMLTIGAIAAIPGYNWYVISSLFQKERAKIRGPACPFGKPFKLVAPISGANLEARQVSFPRQELQLLLEDRVHRNKGRSQPSRLHACVQLILLRHASILDR